MSTVVKLWGNRKYSLFQVVLGGYREVVIWGKLTLNQPPTHKCVQSLHKSIRIYMLVIILGANINLCIFKQIPTVSKGLKMVRGFLRAFSSQMKSNDSELKQKSNYYLLEKSTLPTHSGGHITNSYYILHSNITLQHVQLLTICRN